MGNRKTAKSVAIKFVDDHLPAVVKLIRDKSPQLVPATRALLNLSRKPVVMDPKGLLFGAGTAAPYLIEMSAKAAQWVMAELVAKFDVRSPAAVQAFIRNQWSHYVPKSDKAARGQYFTPAHVVSTITKLITPVLQGMPKAVLLDPAAGAGALLAPFDAHRCIAADIDPVATVLLTELGFAEVIKGNSLVKANRAKFGLQAQDELVLMMNAPFNGSNQIEVVCDEAFKATDACVSFLKMAASLDPKAILSIQPLTTLIKERNFKELGSFAKAYRIRTGFIMSSDEFALGGEEFPLAVMVYTPGSMTFADVEQFAFPIFRNVGGALVDSGDRLQLSKVETTKGLIRNMPPRTGVETESELGIYQFNFRHINFVKAKGNLSDKTSPSMIPVQLADFGQYAYINCFKRHFEVDFVVGNLDPLCRKADLVNQDFVDACIYDAIMANSHRLAPFSRTNSNAVVITRGILTKAQAKAATFQGAGINAHQAFVDFWTKGTGKDALTPFFQDYFAKLKAANLIHTNVAAVIPALAGTEA
jgi:hypothetical protein